MLVSDVSSDDIGYLGQPKLEASAVSAIIKDALGQPYPKITVSAVLSQTGGEVKSGETDDQGRVMLELPSSGVIVKLVPSPGFLNKAVPEEMTVVSKPVSGLFGKWGWGDSASFTVYPKKLEDFFTTNTLIAAGVIGLIVWYYYKD